MKVKKSTKRHDTFRDIHETEMHEPPTPRQAAARERGKVPLVAQLAQAATGRPLFHYRVRACYVLAGDIRIVEEQFPTMPQAKTSARNVKGWLAVAPAEGYQLSQLDVDEYVGEIWCLRTRSAINRHGRGTQSVLAEGTHTTRSGK
jgi:hypothetical protein